MTARNGLPLLKIDDRIVAATPCEGTELFLPGRSRQE